ncbi:pyruvate carboxylase [Kineococcus sp. SYSU DK005]|uniref:pyruvate carboxylase n=1 Tax=Kineococcus sp. SYSU DK005 TaxID=3383126 RepID=UPI003D7E277C
MFRKVLVANRGEIAVRGFRAAYELGARTVAVFAHEDRNSIHRSKADESYLIGQRGHPVRAYLDVAEVVRVARESGADAVYPGYGFLSENPQLARACEAAGIAFVGPPPGVLELAGNKVCAVAAARAAGIATLESSDPSADREELIAAAGQVGFPVFVKAVAGGGGRGMRLVRSAAELPEALAAAMREADGAFGDPTVFLERAVERPRHVEVQVLADATNAAGNLDGVVHLFERDCSLQRRHQKVVEIAPAPNLQESIRSALHADAVRFAREIGYVGAGTVEFLVATAGERAGEHAFIEMNPRIQVEHTVTEEVTDVDLVQAQLRIAAGESLAELGISQDGVRVRGAALQCRITTEDPADGFRPDTGRISAYRSAGGAGVRLDGGTVNAGAEVSPHFDSLLVKLTCRGRDFPTAIARARRALAEFRIRGVATNISFLQAVLDHPDFAAGKVDTSFIAEHPELAASRTPADRGTRLLTYLADVTVNQPNGTAPVSVNPREKLPRLDADAAAAAPPPGSKQRLDELGPQGFAAWLRAESRVHVTDTTFRDAHQSLLATRVRTADLLAVAPTVARTLPDLLSLECWGGATYDVALRFLGEDPWARLAALREAVPNVCLQMLLRGRNTVGYTPYPLAVTDAFVAEAVATGVDVFRIFDALNDAEQVTPAIRAVREAGGALAEAALCYTGDLADPGERLYTLEYYLRLAERFAAAGAHVLAVKDMAGLLRPAAARTLVAALRREFDLPVHLHTHDTAGGQLATLLAAVEAGVDAVDVAVASMAGTTSQPSMSALIAATQHTERETPLHLRAASDLEPYWEAVRRVYAPFESGLPGPTGRVYEHEIPGGQLSNLRQQAIALGLGERFEAVEVTYAAVDRLLGRLVKVTPSSKVVGDLALQLVAAGVDTPEAVARFAEDPASFDLPDSVIGFLAGELGTPPGGWPEPFRTRALAGRTVRPVVAEVPAQEAERLARPGPGRRRALDRLLFPAPSKAYAEHRAAYGDTSVLETLDALYGLRPGVEHVVALEPGVQLIVALEAVSDPDERGVRTVLASLNGQVRPVQVRDRSVDVQVRSAQKADPGDPTHLAAPYAGTVTLAVATGDSVQTGQVLATIEAMKMEAAITAPRAGTVLQVAINPVQPVDAGDLLLRLQPR